MPGIHIRRCPAPPPVLPSSSRQPHACLKQQPCGSALPSSPLHTLPHTPWPSPPRLSSDTHPQSALTNPSPSPQPVPFQSRAPRSHPAGLRIDPDSFSRSRMSYYTRITYAPFTDTLTMPIPADSGHTISGIPEGYWVGGWVLGELDGWLAMVVMACGCGWAGSRCFGLMAQPISLLHMPVTFPLPCKLPLHPLSATIVLIVVLACSSSPEPPSRPEPRLKPPTHPSLHHLSTSLPRWYQYSSSPLLPPFFPPPSPQINYVTWSPDSRVVAFTLRSAGGDADPPRAPLQLWVADIASGQARKLLDQPLNSTFEE